MRMFDFIVLGAGSGGLAAAIRAAGHGARVAVIEPQELGGTCVNVGCVPKKAMWLAARLADSTGLAAATGFEPIQPPQDWQALVARRQHYVENTRKAYRKRIQALGITHVAARGRLLPKQQDLHQVEAGAQRMQAPQVLIATGARARWPQIPGAELGTDSNGFFQWRKPPAQVVIVGAGYIGIELATILDALGSKVTVLARGNVLPQFDAGLVAALVEQMQARGIRLCSGRQVAAVARAGDGLQLELDNGETIPTQALLWAAGRVPNSDDIGLQELGVRCTESGHVQIDEWNATTVEGLHAVGDVTTDVPLTPVAVLAGRILAERLFGTGTVAPMDRNIVPSVLFAHPPLASVGLSEARAREQHGEAVRVYEGDFRAMPEALADGQFRHRVKMICVGQEQRIVGLHALGEGFDEALQGFAVAMRLGATRADFDATIAIHPGVAEELLRAG